MDEPKQQKNVSEGVPASMPRADREPILVFTLERTKPLAQITAADIPRGFSADDVASDVGNS
jgi:hypothetical protein